MTQKAQQVRTSAALLIQRLAADARPVRRLWPASVRFGVWMVLGAAILLYTAISAPRPDLADRVGEPWFICEVGSLLLAASLLAALSVRSSVPGGEPSRGWFACLMILAGAVCLVPLFYPADAGVSVGTFFRAAVLCERDMVLLAMLPLTLLVVVLRRGAPLAGAMTGALAGAAAFMFAGANMRIICPADDRLHLIIGHVLPGVVGVGVSGLAGVLLLRAWRHS